MIEWLIPNVSSFGGHIDQLFTLITVIMGVWFVFAEVVIFYLIFRFKKREGVRGQYITGEAKNEKKWISRPHTLLLVCDIVIVIATLVVWNQVKQSLPPADEKIRVIAQQWAWTFVHAGVDGQLDTEDDIIKVDELHVQEGKTYHYDLVSKDVLHSFSVPVFRLKQDAVPGRVITGWFKAIRTGSHDIQCAEMCGIGHGLMMAKIEIETAEEHRAWVLRESSGLVNAAALSQDSRTKSGVSHE